MTKHIIIGCGGHARSVVNTILKNDAEAEIIFVDENARENEKIFGFDVLPEIDDLNGNIHIALGGSEKRKELLEFYENKNSELKPIISKSVDVGVEASVGNSSFIAMNAYLGPQSKIGRGTIINTGAVVEHEAKIGDFCHISVNSIVCGRVKIGNNVFVGANATVIDYIEICDDVVIGAGSVVNKNITEPGTYVGCPIRKVK